MLMDSLQIAKDSSSFRYMMLPGDCGKQTSDSVVLADLPLFLVEKDGELQAFASEQSGEIRYKGILKENDIKELDGFSVVFFLSIFLAGVGLLLGRGLLWESIKVFLRPKDRTNLFSESSDFNHKIKTILSVQTLLQMSIVAFLYFTEIGGKDLSALKSYLFFGETFVLISLFMGFQYLLNRMLILLFSSERSFQLWKSGRETALSILGLVLLPLTLTATYVDISFQSIKTILICVFVAYFIALVLRGLKIFFHTIPSYFYMILYLCTVILAPLMGLIGILKYVYSLI